MKHSKSILEHKASSRPHRPLSARKTLKASAHRSKTTHAFAHHDPSSTQRSTNPTHEQLEAAFDQAALQTHIPAAYLEGIAEAESSWRQFDKHGHVLRGKVDRLDQGIMQINQKAHPEAFPEARTNFRFNIEYGADILRGFFNRYGSWKKAIAAYNMGSVRYKHGHHGKFLNQPYVDRVLTFAHAFARKKAT